MAETVNKQQLEAATWDAVLRRMGRGAVIAKLSSYEMRPAEGAEFKLFLPDGGRSLKRGYVEKWLGRMEAKAEATEAKRFRYILIASAIAATASVLAVVGGIIAEWPAMHDWIK